jgi:hypothetical protein
MPRKAINRAGQKFGMLTILGTEPSVRRRPMSLCQCECGNIKTIQTNAVVFGQTKSCGCLAPELPDKTIDHTGKRFGKLVVVGMVKTGGRGGSCDCICDCGSTKVVKSKSLISGFTQSCGCLHKTSLAERKRTHIRKRTDTKEYLMYTSAKHRAKKAGIPFEITLEDIIIPEYCPVLNIPIFTTPGESCPNAPSLDRFIPELGYVPGNVTVISFKANTIKNNATTEEIQMVTKWMELQGG